MDTRLSTAEKAHGSVTIIPPAFSKIPLASLFLTTGETKLRDEIRRALPDGSSALRVDTHGI